MALFLKGGINYELEMGLVVIFDCCRIFLLVRHPLPCQKTQTDSGDTKGFDPFYRGENQEIGGIARLRAGLINVGDEWSIWV
jgi:hypothetical protein